LVTLESMPARVRLFWESGEESGYDPIRKRSTPAWPRHGSAFSEELGGREYQGQLLEGGGKRLKLLAPRRPGPEGAVHLICEGTVAADVRVVFDAAVVPDDKRREFRHQLAPGKHSLLFEWTGKVTQIPIPKKTPTSQPEDAA